MPNWMLSMVAMFSAEVRGVSKFVNIAAQLNTEKVGGRALVHTLCADASCAQDRPDTAGSDDNRHVHIG